MSTNGAMELRSVAAPARIGQATAVEQSRAVAEVQAAVSASADDTAIRPFNINFPDADLVDLRRRIAATRWPEFTRPTLIAWSADNAFFARETGR